MAHGGHCDSPTLTWSQRSPSSCLSSPPGCAIRPANTRRVCSDRKKVTRLHHACHPPGNAHFEIANTNASPNPRQHSFAHNQSLVHLNNVLLVAMQPSCHLSPVALVHHPNIHTAVAPGSLNAPPILAARALGISTASTSRFIHLTDTPNWRRICVASFVCCWGERRSQVIGRGR